MEHNGKKESIFRKTSIDRINSPEALNDYVRVASPGVWIILIAIIIFLSGVFVWGIYGHLDTTETAPLVVNDGTAILYIGEDRLDTLMEGQLVTVDDASGKIGKINPNPVAAESVFGSYRLHQFDLWEGDWLFAAPVNIKLKNGVYNASVLIESASPFTLIFK